MLSTKDFDPLVTGFLPMSKTVSIEKIAHPIVVKYEYAPDMAAALQVVRAGQVRISARYISCSVGHARWWVTHARRSSMCARGHVSCSKTFGKIQSVNKAFFVLILIRPKNIFSRNKTFLFFHDRKLKLSASV